MSFVQATPEFVAAAATDLARIGTTITSANTAAMGPTSAVLAPGADEVSASIAALFDAHSQVYQALSAQAAAFHSQFVQLMNGGAMQYAAAEAANATPLQTAAAPASMAAQVPTMTAGAMSASAPTAPAGPLAAAVAPAAAVPAPAGTPVAAAPVGSATLGRAREHRRARGVGTDRHVRRAAGTGGAAGLPGHDAAGIAAHRPALAGGDAATTLSGAPGADRPAPAGTQPAAPPVRRVPIVPPESLA
ncbi:PE family protein [Mycobacterium intracellulare]|uniref:PE family protein n=1 Tax=Mycobacterium intracellulare TaxID=1767 RepID=UPI0022B269FE|nr:PE family protein [Mycobacterium intracellulare]